MAFYPVYRTYVGPSRHDHRWLDFDRVEIWPRAPRTNSSHEVRTDGWLGTTNDVTEYALGEYATAEAAERAVEQYLAQVGWRYHAAPAFPVDDDRFLLDYPAGVPTDVIHAIYWIGNVPPMSPTASGDFVWDSMRERITWRSTDADIDAFVAECEADAERAYGAQLDTAHVRELARDHRDECLAAARDALRGITHHIPVRVSGPDRG